MVDLWRPDQFDREVWSRWEFVLLRIEIDFRTETHGKHWEGVAVDKNKYSEKKLWGREAGRKTANW